MPTKMQKTKNNSTKDVFSLKYVAPMMYTKKVLAPAQTALVYPIGRYFNAMVSRKNVAA